MLAPGRVTVVIAVGVAVAACVVAGMVVGRRVRRRRKWWKVMAVVEELEEACETKTGRLRQLVDAMAVEMHAGLASEGGSKLRMLMTFVDRLPTGEQKGTYYAIHLKGNNLKMFRVPLEDKRLPVLHPHVVEKPILDHLAETSAEGLFDYVALSLKEFACTEEGNHGHIGNELGVALSVPLKQLSISSGVPLQCGKEFPYKNMVGCEIGDSLQKAVQRNGLDMRVTALVNDCVGVLALGHYHDEDTVAAVIIGRGTNACYLERVDAIIKYQGLLTTSGHMVVNMEWGSFWSSHLPRTSYDAELDIESPNPNDEDFEKLVSETYLGDIVRRVILRMAQQSDFFGPVCTGLCTPFILDTSLITKIQQDDSADLEQVRAILNGVLEIPETSLKTRKLIVKICDIIIRRAARLTAAGIVGILKKIGRDGTTGSSGRRRICPKNRTVIAIEGNLYTGCKRFCEHMHEAMNEILGEDGAKNVVFRATKDGSGVGAALLGGLWSS